MIDDPTRTNPLALINTAKISAVSDVVSPVTQYLRITGDAGLIVEPDVVVTVGDAVFKTEQTALSSANLDSGANFIVGNDYYVYICDPGAPSLTEQYRISLNTTFPAGFTADNSRKIGGFHFGVCRRINAVMQPINTAGVERGTGWEGNIYNGILPRSIWTLLHRPKCAPEGMVYMGNGTWVDIYIMSPDGAGSLRSAHNELPATGTEGHHWMRFHELLLTAGKRMMSWGEFLQCSVGAPAGQDNNNTNAWAQTTNTARQRTGFVGPAVSSIGCRDTTGNVSEWLDDIVTYYDVSGANAIGAGAWRDVVGGAQYGQAYMNSGSQARALNAGGAWTDGVSAGPRCVVLNGTPWVVSTGIGVRGACDSL